MCIEYINGDVLEERLLYNLENALETTSAFHFVSPEGVEKQRIQINNVVWVKFVVKKSTALIC